jgi:tetratricopeptide (TPR) repeat protein
MTKDPHYIPEAGELFNEALELDPSNETVLTMFAMFKCNQLANFLDFFPLFNFISFYRNQFEEAAILYERAIQCTRGEDKLLQYAALLYAIRAQGRAVKRLNLNFPGGFPPAGALPNWMGGTA